MSMCQLIYDMQIVVKFIANSMTIITEDCNLPCTYMLREKNKIIGNCTAIMIIKRQLNLL